MKHPSAVPLVKYISFFEIFILVLSIFLSNMLAPPFQYRPVSSEQPIKTVPSKKYVNKTNGHETGHNTSKVICYMKLKYSPSWRRI